MNYQGLNHSTGKGEPSCGDPVVEFVSISQPCANPTRTPAPAAAARTPASGVTSRQLGSIGPPGTSLQPA